MLPASNTRFLHITQVDFSKMSIEAIHRYLVEFDIVPDLNPLPTTALDPPPPSYLLRPRGQRTSTASPAPQPLPPTPANRPRREPSASANRRRSSRLLDDDEPPNVTPILADVGEVQKALAQIAQRHFQEYQVKEVDTLASFMHAVKAKGKSLFWQRLLRSVRSLVDGLMALPPLLFVAVEQHALRSPIGCPQPRFRFQVVLFISHSRAQL